jgi:hypothetical protein
MPSRLGRLGAGELPPPPPVRRRHHRCGARRAAGRQRTSLRPSRDVRSWRRRRRKPRRRRCPRRRWSPGHNAQIRCALKAWADSTYWVGQALGWVSWCWSMTRTQRRQAPCRWYLRQKVSSCCAIALSRMLLPFMFYTCYQLGLTLHAPIKTGLCIPRAHCFQTALHAVGNRQMSGSSSHPGMQARRCTVCLDDCDSHLLPVLAMPLVCWH